MKRKEQTILILVLGALSTISPFAIDMYLPGFPAIAADLNTSIATVQLSLTSYFIGIAGGQLLYGPLLDRFGRKRPLYAGLAVYFLASLFCALTKSVEALIAVRFFQALGGCAGMVAAQTLVRDLFPVERTAQAFSWIILVVAVSPMIAPTVGGYLTISFGWSSVFLALAVITIVIIIMVYYVLPPGRPPDKSVSLRPAAVVKNFYAVMKERQFLIYCIAGGFAGSAPFAFIAGSSDVFINIYRMSEKEFGWIFALIGAVIIGFTQFNHFLLRRFKSQQVIFFALAYQAMIGAILIAGVWLGWFGIVLLTIWIVLFLCVHGLTNANASALSLAPFTKNTGSAASILGTFRMAMGAIVSGLVSAFHNGTEMPMVGMMVCCVIAGLAVLLAARSVVKYQARNNNQDSIVV
jgi:MFS transporter, DHA1 family, multidrug resistance protein